MNIRLSRAFQLLAVAAALVVACVEATPASSTTGVAYKPRLIVIAGQARTDTNFTTYIQHGSPSTAEVAVWVPAGYRPTLGQAPEAKIGSIVADRQDRGLTAPFTSNTITVADPAAYANAACDNSSHSAVWLATLTSATTTFSFPVFVHALAGQPTELHWCFSKNDPQLATLAFHLSGVFTQPVRGNFTWDGRFQPYNATTGTELDSDQVSSLDTLRFPQIISLRASYSRRTHTYRLTARATDDGKPVHGSIQIYRSVGGGPYITNGQISPPPHLLPSGVATDSGHLSTSKIVRFKAQYIATPATTRICGKDVNGVPCVNASVGGGWERFSNIVAIHP